MNRDNDDIDRLLQANVEGQLSRVDWDRFSDDVSKRLATIGLRPRSRSRYLGPLAIAAGLALVVGVLVAVVVNRREPTAPLSGRATVSLHEVARGQSTATVVLGDERVARCEVTFINSSGSPAGKPTQASWCLVAQSEPSSDENVRRSDRTNLPCLF